MFDLYWIKKRLKESLYLVLLYGAIFGIYKLVKYLMPYFE